MGEFDVILRARRLLKRLPLDALPVPLDAYLNAASEELAGASLVLRRDSTLGSDEPGHSLALGGKHYIVLNANDSAERQRFTACHELAHLLLCLPTEHGDDSAAFARRSPNETLCDVYAAEILLPFPLIKARVEDMNLDFASVDELAALFQASRLATGSRFAVVCDRPCAFVLAKNGIVRYASLSTSLRQSRGWIRPRLPLPASSLAAHLRRGADLDGPIEVPAADWLDDWKRGGLVLEDARHHAQWDQTLSLICFDDDQIPVSADSEHQDEDEEEPALRELDGVLPWPGRRRRRP